MSLLNKAKKNKLTIQLLAKKQFDAPDQAIHIKQPSNGVALQSKLDVAKLLVLELPYKDTEYKEHYIVDSDVFEHLDRKACRFKTLHIVKTEYDELKCILLPLKTNNSWHLSNLELLQQAEVIQD